MEKRISGHTGLMALFGTPVGHSGSPAMYNFSFQHDGLDYAYMAFDVTEEEMPKVFESIRLLNMRGGNFTMPCKNIAAQLVDKLSPAAEIIGACNVFVNDDGVITGHITDGVGFVKNLELNGAPVKDILVNATIMGMKPHQDVTLVDKSLFRKDLVVADTVYSPEKTKMILEAEEAGCKAIGGVGMLQQQGAVNYGLFVGKGMPLAEYQEFQKAQAK